MRGISPWAAGVLLLLGAAGLLGLTGTEGTRAGARNVSAWMIRQTLGDVALTDSRPVETERPEAAAPAETAPSPSPRPVPVELVEEAWDERARAAEQEMAQTPEPMETAVPVTAEATGLELRNNTGYAIDLTDLPALPEGLDFSAPDPVILIVHTHTTESYLRAGEDPAEAVYRSRSEEEGVMAAGDVLAETLEARGYGVFHDKTLCDYPEYNGAYSRSRALIQQDLERCPSICLVLDLHRDAVADSDGKQMRLACTLDGEAVAQVMLVVGTDDGGLDHPDWRENLSLAAVLQGFMNRESPGMARPINLRSERFNQDLGPLALLVEVGASGNSQQEAVAAAERLGCALAEVLDRYSGKSS